jgi:hypothetical protein
MPRRSPRSKPRSRRGSRQAVATASCAPTTSSPAVRSRRSSRGHADGRRPPPPRRSTAYRRSTRSARKSTRWRRAARRAAARPAASAPTSPPRERTPCSSRAQPSGSRATRRATIPMTAVAPTGQPVPTARAAPPRAASSAGPAPSLPSCSCSEDRGVDADPRCGSGGSCLCEAEGERSTRDRKDATPDHDPMKGGGSPRCGRGRANIAP